MMYALDEADKAPLADKDLDGGKGRRAREGQDRD